jgi:hypothetical protein
VFGIRLDQYQVLRRASPPLAARRSPLADLVDLSRPHSDQKDLGLGVGDLDVRPARGIEAQLHRAVPVRDAEIDRLGLGR